MGSCRTQEHAAIWCPGPRRCSLQTRAPLAVFTGVVASRLSRQLMVGGAPRDCEASCGINENVCRKGFSPPQRRKQLLGMGPYPNERSWICMITDPSASDPILSPFGAPWRRSARGWRRPPRCKPSASRERPSAPSGWPPVRPEPAPRARPVGSRCAASACAPARWSAGSTRIPSPARMGAAPQAMAGSPPPTRSGSGSRDPVPAPDGIAESVGGGPPL